MTIWPARVPVSVEFCPLANNATANKRLASEAPSTGESSWYASRISATSWCPEPWKAAQASTRIAALIKNARNSANVESIVANLMALALPDSDWS